MHPAAEGGQRAPQPRPPALASPRAWIWSFAAGVKLVKLQLTEAASPATKLVRLTARGSGALHAATEERSGRCGPAHQHPTRSLPSCNAAVVPSCTRVLNSPGARAHTTGEGGGGAGAGGGAGGDGGAGGGGQVVYSTSPLKVYMLPQLAVLMSVACSMQDAFNRVIAEGTAKRSLPSQA